MAIPVSTELTGIRHVNPEGLHRILLIKLNFHFYPIGLAHVAGGLRGSGIAYDVVDLSVTPSPDWASILKEGQYVAAATGGLFGDFLDLGALFRALKAVDPSLPIILGGAITWDNNPGLLMSHLAADYLVVGEGEFTLPELIRHLADGKGTLDEIPGLVWRTGVDGITRSRRRPPVDLTLKNFMPDWEIVDYDFYQFPYISILTGRGCTGTCTFCSPTNGKFRARPVSHIMEEIEHDLARYPVEGIGFHTEILFPDAETTLEFCERYKKLTPHKPFGCCLRVDFPTEVLPALAEAGCRHIHIGVESGSDRVLGLMKKRTTTAMVRSFMAAARKVPGLTIRSSIMFGNFDETAEDIDATVDLACELGIRQNAGLVLNYPGTLNFRRAKERGLVADDYDYLVNMTKLVGCLPHEQMTRHNNGTAVYPNLSAMDTPELLKKTEQGLRRFYTTCHRGKVVDAKVLPGAMVSATVACPFCGVEHAAIYDPLKQTALNMDWECSCSNGDFRPVYVPAQDLPLYGPHMERCEARFRAAQRIAVLIGGGDRKADLFLWADRMGLDFDRIVAFVATPTLPRGWIANYPILPLEDVRDLEPDLFAVPFDFPRNFLRERLGDSPAWALPDRDLYASEAFAPVPGLLGAELVHLLPF